jgi:hypothetical protein
MNRENWAYLMIGATFGVLLVAGLLGLVARTPDQRPALCTSPSTTLTVATGANR